MATRSQRDKVVGFVPARGGSKSIPLKNIRPLAGRPLVYWVLDALAGCSLVDEVYVGTDDHRIERAVQEYGRGVRLSRRSPETATDEAASEAALLEFARQVSFDHLCFVQATSPLLATTDIETGLRRYLDGGYDSLLSVVRQRRFLWNVGADEMARPLNYDPRRRPRRQEMEGFLVENGAMYITSREALLKSGCRISGKIAVYEMPPESYVELDEPEDWPLVERLLMRRKGRKGRSMDEALKRIRVLAMDVDGVLTDAGMYYGVAGEELKKFNTRDGKGIELIRELGIVPVIVTSENTEIVAARARKLGIERVYMGVKDKRRTVEDVCADLGATMDEVAFIGDDINDVEALRGVGLSVAPFDAQDEARQVVDYVCKNRGGAGCVRELCDLILNHRRSI